MKQGLPALFASTLFLSAALLFTVEPMVARRVLPTLGGTPAVWTTCMLFFQSTLLAGYAYALVLGSKISPRRQAVVHTVLFAAGLAFLPSVNAGSASGLAEPGDPTVALIVLLVRSVGLPVFLVGTTAPLLQQWFAATDHPTSGDPYPLFAASNAGSLLALLAYPVVIERRLGLVRQFEWWGRGLVVLSTLVAACGAVTWYRSTKRPGLPESRIFGGQVERGSWLVWVVLAMIPSSLMLGVTSYLTTDLAAVPLLWLVPLGLYLLSFVAVFARRPWVTASGVARVFPWLVMPLTFATGFGLVQPLWIPLHLSAFFAAALLCHGELARRRPHTTRLASFYLATAVGGTLGGVFNALVAPRLFDRVAEYPLALVAACLVLAFRVAPSGEAPVSDRGGRGPTTQGRLDLAIPAIIGVMTGLVCADTGGFSGSLSGALATMTAAGLTLLVALSRRRRPLRFALTVGALLAASSLSPGVGGRVLYRERSFFGVLRVTETSGGHSRRLFHGSTLHGEQSLDPGRRREPLTYFTRTGPVGDVFRAVRGKDTGKNTRVAVTGVGVGSLASYAVEGDDWTFYEIDPAVVRVARDSRYFTFLADCRASRLGVRLGDARLTLGSAADRRYDLIILDAFSSDSIPTHLMTREAFRLYRRKLAGGGLLAFHITNRYLDLAPVVALLARDASWECRVRTDAKLSPAEKAGGKQGSIWAVLGRDDRDLGSIVDDPNWQTPRTLPGDRIWTDDESNLVDHFRFLSRNADRP